jgi:hypothetical protein
VVKIATIREVRQVAQTAAEEAERGRLHFAADGVTFDLTEKGFCNRFVRQVHEAALGLAAFAWPWARRYAIWTDFDMRAAELEVPNPEQADIVCFDGTAPRNATPGHIGIYLGGGLVAENTSSGRRGKPRRAGTKISRIEEIDPSGTRRRFFRTVPLAVAEVPAGYQDGPVTILGPSGGVVSTHGYLSGGRTGANDAAKIAAKVGIPVRWPAGYPAQAVGPAGELLEDCTAYVAGDTVGVNNLRVLLEAYGYHVVDNIPASRAVQIVKVA